MTIEKMPKQGDKTMSRQQILEKAIKLAIKNGWNDEWISHSSYELDESDSYRLVAGFSDYSLRDVIFNHDFAKALWGEEFEELPMTYPHVKEMIQQSPNDYIFEGATVDHFRKRTHNAGWQYHLQQMVMAEDPIEYLGNNI